MGWYIVCNMNFTKNILINQINRIDFNYLVKFKNSYFLYINQLIF